MKVEQVLGLALKRLANMQPRARHDFAVHPVGDRIGDVVQGMPHAVTRPAPAGIVHLAFDIAIPPDQHFGRYAAQQRVADGDTPPAIGEQPVLYLRRVAGAQRPEQRTWRRKHDHGTSRLSSTVPTHEHRHGNLYVKPSSLILKNVMTVWLKTFPNLHRCCAGRLDSCTPRLPSAVRR